MSRKRRHKKRHEEETETARSAALQGEPVEPVEPVENVERERDPEEAHERNESGASADAPSDPPETAGRDGTEQGTVPTDDEELERLAAEARNMRALAQRKQAEFENYRKRIERERDDTMKYASANVMKEILPVLDNLERAVEASKSEPAGSTGNEDQLREGVAIIARQFRETLERLGLSEIEAEKTPFDPHVHEAVSRVETDEYPEGTVVEVLQKGYLFKDRLLRPSMVSVALPSGGESASASDAGETEDDTVPQEE